MVSNFETPLQVGEQRTAWLKKKGSSPVLGAIRCGASGEWCYFGKQSVSKGRYGRADRISYIRWRDVRYAEVFPTREAAQAAK